VIKRFQPGRATPQLRAWAEQYGIDVNVIPLEGVLTLDHEKKTITFIEYVRGPSGRVVIHDRKPITRRRIIHLTTEELVDPPDAVEISTVRVDEHGETVPRA
jgi:hypothetical protein